MPCSVNKKRNWTFRLELEAQNHVENCVVTLTYNELNVPSDGSLVKEHAQKWIRKLRKILAPSKIRYYLVGEYGGKKKRPHYHAIVFGLGADRGGGPVTLLGRIEGVVKKAWPYGNVLVDDCKPEGIAYVAGYVTKKLTSDERKSNGLVPEFTRMSLRPGIGAQATKAIASSLASHSGQKFIRESGDVPHALLRAGKIVPIGRYLRGLLRAELAIGAPDENGKLRKPPLQKAKKYWAEMYQLRREAAANTKGATSFKSYLVDMNAQKIKNLEARLAIQPIKESLS
jgi:hypothetical protein